MLTQREFAEKYSVPVAKLEEYARCGLLVPVLVNDHIAYNDRSALRLEVIMKAESLEFSYEEIKLIIEAFVP